MQKMIGALLLTGMFLVTAMPAHAAASDGWTVLLDNTGKVTILPTSQTNQDGFSSCSGDAPLSNSCTLTDFASFGWLIGWNTPGSWMGTPIGTLELSTHLLMTTSNGGVVEFECDWGINPANTIAPGMIRCALEQYAGDVFGVMTINYHAGLIDPHVLQASLPSTNSVEAGIGNWQAIEYGF